MEDEITIVVPDVTCPRCKGNTYERKPVEDENLYICQTPNCGMILSLCNKCNKVYSVYDFGDRNSVYECKKCGATNWPLTEYYKTMREAQALQKQLDALYKKAYDSMRL